MKKKMSKRMLTALKKSIKHWEDNVAAEKPDDAIFGSGACALCAVYQTDSGCGVCPAAQAAFSYCGATPYFDACESHTTWEDDSTSKNRTLYRRDARKELNFLKSLLPEGET